MGGRQYSQFPGLSSQRGSGSRTGWGRGCRERGRDNSFGSKQDVPMPFAVSLPTLQPAFIPFAAPSVAMALGPSFITVNSSASAPSAYDGRKSLYTAGALAFTSREFVVKLTNTNTSTSSSTLKRKEQEFKVALKMAGKADLNCLQHFLSAKQIDAPYETIQALDIVLRQMTSEKSSISPDLKMMRGNLGDDVDFWWQHYP